MIAPMLKEDFQNKTLEELMVIRNDVLSKINDYENKYIFSKMDINQMILTKPSPHTINSVNNENLIMLTELILEKGIQQ